MSNLFKTPSIPSPAAMPAATPMPIPDEEAIKAAKRQSMQTQLKRKGRQSTILSEDGDMTALTG